MLLTMVGLKAQDCETIMLPFFNYDRTRMEEYPAPKFEWRCQFASHAFYVTDEVPADAELMSITQVKDIWTGEALKEDFKVDLTTLSYYAYNFELLQLTFKSPRATICFSTPGSEHRYLVLRSLYEMNRRTSEWEAKQVTEE